jgi:Uma2 family endonuclease
MAQASTTAGAEPDEPMPQSTHVPRDDRRAAPPGPMTYEQFLDWADEDTRAEWVDGEVIVPSPANREHQDIAGFLFEVIGTFARMHQLGTMMRVPFQMKLAHSGREPDVMFIAAAHLDQLKSTYLDGPADLVIEIVSPESVERDRREKFAEYEEAGIPEYWLIDPLADHAEFYQLDAAGRYQAVPPDANGAYHARALTGLWLRVAWLWQETLPDPARVLFTVDREAYAAYLARAAELPDV